VALKTPLPKVGLLLLEIVSILLTFSTVQAQSSKQLEIRLVRTFGFQAGLQIQGSFSARISGPEDLARVGLYLDGELIGEDDEAPFRIDFNTADFTPGEHVLWAEGTTQSGDTLSSVERRLIFLTADETLGSVSRYLLPIFMIIGAGILISYLVFLFSGRNNRFRLGEYGAAGGAVCRRCGLPFARHILAPNLLVGKLERCPHCGHWAISRRASAAKLKQAEERYETDRQVGSYQPPVGEEEWKRRIEDSRFED
jgi:hypothetical protein